MSGATVTPAPPAAAAESSRWWRSGASILGARAGDALLRFLLFLATARLLAGPDFSRYALVTAALATAQTLVAFGAPRTASYFEGRVSASVLAGWLTAMAIVPSLILLAILGLAAPLRNALFPALSRDLLLLGLAPLPFLLLGDSLVAVVIARRRERLYGPLVWSRSGATAVVLAASLAVPDRLRWILGGRLAVSIAVAAALLALLAAKPTLRGVRAFGSSAAPFAFPAAAAGSLSALHRRADVFLLSALGKTAQIGPYAIAYTLAEAFWIVTDSLEASLFVDLARMEHDAARRQARRAATAYAVLGLLATLGIVAGQLVLRLGFRRDYPEAPALFTWVLLAAILWGTSRRPFGSFLYARGAGSRVAAASAAALACNVGLCLAWIPSQGALGAAKATLASSVVLFAALALFARGRSAPPPPLSPPPFSSPASPEPVAIGVEP